MLIRFIFYSFVFYIVIKILRIFLNPVVGNRKEPIVRNDAGGTTGTTTSPKKPIVGEYIEYEEIK